MLHNNYFINMTMLQYWVYWIIFILSHSCHIYYWYIYLCIYIYIYIYIYIFIKLAIFILFFVILLSTVIFFLKKYFVKLMSRLLHSAIHQVMWYFWVFIVNPFSLLCSIFFPKKTVFPLVSLSLTYRWVNQLRYFW